MAKMKIRPSQPYSPPEMPMQEMPMQMDVSMQAAHAAEAAMHSTQFQKKHPSQPPSADELRKELKQLRELSEKVNRQLKRGQLEKTTLITLNEKLGYLKINYGNIAAISVAAAGIISGLKDLIELIQMFD
ncbi:hypothetical protein [Staphylospora marina]|uniref:hypothetical protein n=1 Tax=Staphylospora marina TaxID=2490858 RepID=UPI000F5BD5B2|nr:hypothetical protein [Staphylospora marina]